MWNRWRQWIKASPARGNGRVGAGFAAPPARPAGWWRDDHVEQLRNYQSWVYAAVNAIAQEVARQRPFLFVNTGPADHEQTPLPHTHPLARLLDHPNPWMTPWELWYLTVLYLELTGNCYWYAAPRVSGQPGELWIVPTPWVRVIPDPVSFVKGYEVAVPGVPTEVFAPDEVIHLKYPNPLDVHYGLSPLQANALTIDANTELQKSRYQTFLSGQRPGVVLHTDQTLTEPTVRRLEEKIQSRFGGRENWTRPLVLEQGLKASPWTLTPAEMDYLNSAKLSRDEIFALFRVPTPIAGIVENMGLGADIWYGARVMFCEGTVQPKLDLIAQAWAGDVLLPAGLRNADEFLRNPVVLWAHQRSLPPIGTCERLTIEAGRVIAETKFSQTSPFARDVFNLYAEGVLRGWSVGFVPVKGVPIRVTRDRPQGGVCYPVWDLLEYSAVPVPENPQALTLAVRKGLVKDSDLRHWLVRDVLAGLVA